MAKKKPKPASRKKPTPRAVSLTAVHPEGMIFTITLSEIPGDVGVDLRVDAHPRVAPEFAQSQLALWRMWSEGFCSGVVLPEPDGWEWVHEEGPPPSAVVH